MSEEIKQSFFQKAALDKARYQVEMAAFTSTKEAADEEEMKEKGDEGSDGGQEEEGESTKVTRDDVDFNGAMEEEEEGSVGDQEKRVKLTVKFKDDNNIMQAKESTPMWKIKEKLSEHYERSPEGLVLKHVGAKVGDNYTAGSYQGVTLVMEVVGLGVNNGQSGGVLRETEFEARNPIDAPLPCSPNPRRMCRFMGLFQE